MTKIELEIHDDVISTLNKLRNINDSGVELEIPDGSVLFENILNLKLIETRAQKFGLTVHFSTTDEVGNNLISQLDEKGGIAQYAEVPAQETPATAPLSKGALPKLHLTIPAPIKGFKFRPGFNVKYVPAGLFVALIIVLIYYLGNKIPKASAKIVIDSQPLTRSITIRVKKDAPSDPDQKILRGTNVQVTTDDSMEAATTGEKIVGKKAKGTVTIYNKTDADKEFKKGTVVIYDENTRYVLNDTVTAPKRVEQPPDPSDPTKQVFDLGEVDADVTAEDVGDKYNIDSGKDLNIKGYKSSEFTAKTKTSIGGGSSKKVKIVSADDQTNLAKALLTQSTDKATKALEDKIGGTQKLISGSVMTTVVKQTYTPELGAESDKLTLNNTVSAEGLVYLTSDLNTVLDKLVEGLVPEGFTLSDKDREVKVEVLGNSTSSILTSTEADIQVTLKAFVVPNINADQIKKELMGKTPKEAERILGSIRNIKTYEFKLSPSIPFFQRVPKDPRRISIETEIKESQ